ncbi:hypothetical protein SDC9_102772 [bioreactor metagenome]|uniref:Uncharacterized protein n=1 Tax=bioreactor metagenome TaxID=1076179 RepID=A0A645B2N6_9ZZZZ
MGITDTVTLCIRGRGLIACAQIGIVLNRFTRSIRNGCHIVAVTGVSLTGADGISTHCL